MPPKAKSKEIEFRMEAPAGLEVYVAGTFNNWDTGRHQLIELPTGGEYVGTVRVPAGTHQYRFIVAGEWWADCQNPATAPDGYGGINSVLSV